MRAVIGAAVWLPLGLESSVMPGFPTTKLLKELALEGVRVSVVLHLALLSMLTYDSMQTRCELMSRCIKMNFSAVVGCYCAVLVSTILKEDDSL